MKVDEYIRHLVAAIPEEHVTQVRMRALDIHGDPQNDQDDEERNEEIREEILNALLVAYRRIPT